MQTKTEHPWNWLLFPFSSVIIGNDAVFAASSGYGVYEMDEHARWGKLGDGLPDDANIHRLQMQREELYACTNLGLYRWDGSVWRHDGLSMPSYQYRIIGKEGWAAAENGLWMKTGSGWTFMDCPGRRVYDFMNLPHYLVVGHDRGISLYDRFMDEWAHFDLNRCITSLAVFRGHIVGTSDRGELLAGDRKGRFDRIGFGGIFVFSVAAKGGDVYACTERGLFKLAYAADRLMLLSVKLGFPVTDIDIRDNKCYMATLFQGIQTMDM
jgi:hypothetical protein